MLKYFYKTFLVSILCGSLLMIDMSYKAGVLNISTNVAKAESVSTGGVSDKNLMDTLTMVAISVIASRLVAYGKITTDIALAAAGGLAFIAGDMAATSKLKEAKKKIETSIQRNKNGDLTDEQRQYLIRLIEMYRASKDAATTKKNLQMAAAAAFAAAAVAAYMASAQEATQWAACTTAITTSYPTVTAMGAAIDASCIGSCGGVAAASACNATSGQIAASIQMYKSGRAAPAPSCSAMPTVIGSRTTLQAENTALPASCTMVASGVMGVTPACQAMFVGDQMNESGCLSPAILYATTAAAVLMMGITASTIITIVVGISAPLAEMVDIAIYTPSRRAIVWGVLAGLSFAASSATSNVIAKIDEDIKKLEDLVNTINMQANGNLAHNTIQKKNPTISSLDNRGLSTAEKSNESVDIPLKDGARLPCVTNADSKDGKNCGALSAALSNSGGFNNLPEGFKSDAMQIAKMADGLNGSSTISGSTLNSASSVGSNALRIANELKKQKTEYQSKLISSGSKLNLDDEEARIKNQIESSYNNILKKNKTSNSALLAAYGMGAGTSDLAKTTDEANKKLGSKFTNNFGKFTVPTFNLNTGVGAVSKAAVDLTTDSEAAKLKAEREALVKASDIDDYEMKTDINKDASENIFDVISTRYKKSGYPRLFKRLNE